MPFARATGIGSTAAWADHSKRVWRRQSSTICSPVIVSAVVVIMFGMLTKSDLIDKCWTGFQDFQDYRILFLHMNSGTELSRERIQATERVIRPYIRRTPIIEVDGADFGLDSIKITFKLELLQHAGSFKPRGAFTNILTRRVPEAGVVAASGGNHGVAVAFAAMK